MKTLRVVPAILTAIAVVVASFSTVPAALAGKNAGVSSTTFKLAPPVNAPEPRVAGQYTLYRDSFNSIEEGTVSCRNLTPGRQYTIVVLVHWSQWARIGYTPTVIAFGTYSMELAVAAEKGGRLKTQFTVVGSWSPTGGVDRSVQDLWIENEQGSVVLE